MRSARRACARNSRRSGDSGAPAVRAAAARAAASARADAPADSSAPAPSRVFISSSDAGVITSSGSQIADKAGFDRGRGRLVGLDVNEAMRVGEDHGRNRWSTEQSIRHAPTRSGRPFRYFNVSGTSRHESPGGDDESSVSRTRPQIYGAWSNASRTEWPHHYRGGSDAGGVLISRTQPYLTKPSKCIRSTLVCRTETRHANTRQN